MPLVYRLAKIYWHILRPKTRGVKVIVRFRNEILLVKNTYAKKRWTLPGGGVKKGESPEKAAKREVSEEVGISISNLENHGSIHYTGDGKRDTIWIFRTAVKNKDFYPDNIEIAEAKWFPIDNLPPLESKVARKCLDVAKIL